MQAFFARSFPKTPMASCFFHVHMSRVLFSDITPEEFKNVTITGYFWFVFEENFVRDIM